MTLSEAFVEGAKRGIIDWSLRVDTFGGIPKFYIHPSHRPGVTLDFALDIDAFGKEILEPRANNNLAVWPEDNGSK